MSVTKIKASNFKSFEDFELDLNNFNVLIGGNASGKSNFVEIFQFLRDIANYDLEKAIYMHGGFEYLPNIYIGKSKELKIGITSDLKKKFAIEKKTPETKDKIIIGVQILELDYEISIKFSDKKDGNRVSNEVIVFKCNFWELEENENEKLEETKKIGEGSIELSNVSGKIKFNLIIDNDIPLEKNDLIPDTLIKLVEKILEDGLYSLISSPLSSLPVPWKSIFTNLKVYDFDPKKSKETVKITGSYGLDEDGQNMSIILQDILNDDEESRKFYNFIQDLLPFIEKIDVKSFFDKSLIFRLKEKRNKTDFLPASELSDGTINIIALIIALYHERVPFIIIEEPERNIHPFLISKIVEMVKESSKRKQVILTTHSPEILKYAGMNHIYFISRDEKFFSTVFKPAEKEEVKSFLELDIGIDELYIDNLLGD